MKEKTRKEMQQKLADYRRPAPDISWTELEKALPAPKARPAAIWGRLTATAAAVVLAAGLGWMLMRSEQQAGEQQTAQTDTGSQPATTSVAANHPTTGEPSETAKKEPNEMVTDEPAEPVVAQYEDYTDRTKQGTYGKQSTGSLRKTVAENNVPSSAGDATSSPEQASDSAVTAQEYDTEKETDKPEEKPSSPQKDTHRPTNNYPAGIEQSPTLYAATATDSRLSAQAYLSNPMTGISSFSSTTPVMNNASPMGPYDSSLMDNEFDPASFNQFTPIEEHYNHHQPLRIGLSLRYQLSRRWSIEAGLAYTRLTADLTRISNGVSYDMKQELNYVGVPANVGYQLWSNSHFQVYASAGATLEKMVKGNRTNADYKEKVSIRPLQFSLNGAAGAEYRFTPAFSIYAEPGVAYHFDNHSSVSTFYQEKPFSFNLNLGMRFQINKSE